jgi:hypothetical protein
MSVPRRIAAFLDLAAQDTDAARTLAKTKNRIVAAPDMAQISADADDIDVLIGEARAQLK